MITKIKRALRFIKKIRNSEGRKEWLECECGNDDNHFEYNDKNGETIVECKKCNQFIKYPKN